MSNTTTTPTTIIITVFIRSILLRLSNAISFGISTASISEPELSTRFLYAVRTSLPS